MMKGFKYVDICQVPHSTSVWNRELRLTHLFTPKACLYSKTAFVFNQHYCVDFFLSSPVISSGLISFLSFYNVCYTYICGTMCKKEH